MLGLAVNVTLAPEQILVVVEVIVTSGVTFAVTAIVIELDAVFGEAHPSLLVKVQAIISPLFKALLLNVAPIVDVPPLTVQL